MAKAEIQACIVSYPKTGRTWLRILIGRYLCTVHGFEERNISRTEPLTVACGLLRTKFAHGQSGFQRRLDYRALEPGRDWYRGRKVLLLGRDVRDTMVSAYFWATRKLRVFDGPISDFVRDGSLGAPKYFTYYRHWHVAREVPQAFVFLRYEDMHRDPAAALAVALKFIGVKRIDASALREAVEYSSFENLRRIESAGLYRTTIIPTSIPKSSVAAEVPKFRSGRVGAFGEHLNARDIAWIDAMNAELGCEFTRA